MLVNADLHIHSRYSGATSDRMTIKEISIQAPRKGISLVATGDCLNSNWQKEIKACQPVDDGTYELNGTRFILSVEVEDERRVHHLVYFPCFSAVDAFKEAVAVKSRNLESDGRPNIHMGGIELAACAKDVGALIGPAHAFTPWTAMYAYHTSLEDCYGELSSYISFVELGLSADTDYADTIEELSRLTFLTNSDSHSPHPVRLAREFNRFEVQDATFEEIRKGILRQAGRRLVLNVGLPPQEGKYNETACISCFTHYTVEDAVRRKWKCSCGKRIKKGVRDRIREIATYPEPHHPAYRPPYLHLIPLAEIITKALGQHTPFTQSVAQCWDGLIGAFGSEIAVLIDADIKEVARVAVPAVTDAIQAFREHTVVIIPGGGGQYGKIELPREGKPREFYLGPKNLQASLLDY